MHRSFTHNITYPNIKLINVSEKSSGSHISEMGVIFSDKNMNCFYFLLNYLEKITLINLLNAEDLGVDSTMY